MAIEYLGLSEINGPLVVLEGVKNAAYEEICYTWNEIQDGVGERKAYENFGNRCALWQYKRLASLLTQNLRKGSSELTELLSKESELAMEQRRNLAKRLGEEAGTAATADAVS